MATAEGTGWKGFWMMLVMVCAAAALLLLTTISDSHAMAKSKPHIGATEIGAEPAISCIYEHVGVEDHWQGHSSCAACLGEHHECEVKCYSLSWSCVARGTDSAGELTRVSSSGAVNELGGSEDALKKCRSSGAANCGVESCIEVTRPHSRGSC